MKKLIMIFKKNNKRLEIWKNRNNNVILPNKDPIRSLLIETFLFNVKFTVNNSIKSIAKCQNLR